MSLKIITKTRLSITFIIPDTDRKIKGVFVSPDARRMEAPKLKSNDAGIPRNIICIYKVASLIISSGVDIISSINFDKNRPRIVRKTPLNKEIPTDVCTDLLTAFEFFAPVKCATQTLVPLESPINKLVNKLIREPVAPTAANELLPAYRPTTITSAALYKSCKTPVNIMGNENISIFVNTFPSSIREFLFMTKSFQCIG